MTDLNDNPNDAITNRNDAGGGTPEDTSSQLAELTRQVERQSKAIREMREERQTYERQMADLIRNVGTGRSPEPPKEPDPQTPKPISFAELGKDIGKHVHENVNMRGD